jgi:predicted Rossmann-fold nucleotide-binding protein
MKLTFIGSGVEREMTRLNGIEVQAVAQVAASYFDTLIFGGSSVGLMEAFATAFAARGGRLVSVVPRWLEQSGLVYTGCDPMFCEDLAGRKKLMFDETDAVLCYPGGIGTWDELFDLIARRATERSLVCPPVYIYNWEKYYAPLLLQIETALEVGLVDPHTVAKIRPFESAEAFATILQIQRQNASLDGPAPPKSPAHPRLNDSPTL